MTTTTLPTPTAWQKKKPFVLFVFFVLLFSIGAVACAVKGWRSLATGSYLTAVVAISLCVLALSSLTWVSRSTVMRSVRFRSHVDPSGTLLTLGRLSQVNYYTLMISCLVASGLFAIFEPRGSLDFDLSPGRRIFYPFWAGAIALYSLYILILALQRSTSSIRLTANGFELFDGATLVSGTWSETANIAATRPNRKYAREITFTADDGEQQKFGSSAGFTPGGVALYWMIHHYWKHLEDRVELTDDRALERLRDERFDTTD